MHIDDNGPHPAAGRRLWPGRPQRRQRSLWWPVAAAAAVIGLALLLAATGCRLADFADLADRTPLPATPVDMDTAAKPLAAIFNLGMAHYATGDWPAAADQLGRADRMLQADPRSGPADQPLFAPFVRMYQGVALLQGGQVAEARAVFDALADPAVARPLRERGLWYGAQCRLLQGEPDGALGLLAELGGSPVYAELARDQAEAVSRRLGR